jgi:prepilin-type N-terminal cleavage/methylation domain-containing protein
LRQRKQNSFTLIELLIVIAIISILAIIIIIALSSAKARAKDAKIKHDLDQVRTLANLWNEKQGSYSYFCDKDSEYQRIADDIMSNKTAADVRCYDSKNEYAISSDLNLSCCWCMDSTGSSVAGVADGSTCSSVAEKKTFPFVEFFTQGRNDLVKNLGANWIRIPGVDWDLIETSQNNWDWNKVDSAVNGLKSYDLQAAINVKTGQNWATNSDCNRAAQARELTISSCPPADLRNVWNNNSGYSPNYYDFVWHLTRHLKGKIEYFIIENEANNPTYWFGTKEEFIKLRKTAYKAVHDANPRAKVVDNGWTNSIGAAIANDLYNAGNVSGAINFINGFYARRAGFSGISTEAQLVNILDGLRSNIEFINYGFSDSSFDVMSFHFSQPYNYLDDVINWTKNKMSGMGSKEIWNSEGGLSDGKGTVSEVQAAQEIVKLHAIGFANGLTKWVWIPMIESGGEMVNFEGLYDSAKNLTRGGKAYQVMVEKINKYSNAEKLNLGSNVSGFRFIVNSKSVYILWSTATTTIDFRSEIEGTVKITNIDGANNTTPSSELPLTASPIFAEKD